MWLSYKSRGDVPVTWSMSPAFRDTIWATSIGSSPQRTQSPPSRIDMFDLLVSDMVLEPSVVDILEDATFPRDSVSKQCPGNNTFVILKREIYGYDLTSCLSHSIHDSQTLVVIIDLLDQDMIDTRLFQRDETVKEVVSDDSRF